MSGTMKRRDFLTTTALGVGSVLLAGCSSAQQGNASDSDIARADAFRRSRQFAETRYGRIAYVEQGSGPSALFLHGYPLNGFQWRGALKNLSHARRCIAPDFMGLGHTEVGAEQNLSPQAQTDSFISFLDRLSIDSVDVVANDSGGTIAQLLAVQHPARVRTMLLTNCDVHENSPPKALAGFINLAREGRAADEWLSPQLADKSVARSSKGLGRSYTDPANLTDDSIEYYFTPLLSSALRKAQFNNYAVSFYPNPLLAVESALKRCEIPTRILWGTADDLFPTLWADWLDRALPGSRGVRLVEGAKLFFPEEMPQLIAEEALRLWNR